MVGRLNRRRTWLVALALALACGLPQAALAQGSGKVEGVVKDAQGQPVDGATVVFQLGSGKKTELKTNKQGQYSSSLPTGDYNVLATKGTLLSVPVTTTVKSGSTATNNIALIEKREAEAGAAAASAAAKEEAARVAEFKASFDAAVAAAGAGRHDEAVEKFAQAAAVNPKCSDCFTNMGTSYLQKKDYDKAADAFNKSNAIKPSETNYTGLAQAYTGGKKLDMAADAMKKAGEIGAASAPAGGGGNADSLFNQGVTLWNAGKIEEAKKQFQAAVAANPNHAEAHYQLGMALVNEGNLPGAKTEWETYLKLAPSGSHAAEVNAMLPSLK